MSEAGVYTHASSNLFFIRKYPPSFPLRNLLTQQQIHICAAQLTGEIVHTRSHSEGSRSIARLYELHLADYRIRYRFRIHRVVMQRGPSHPYTHTYTHTHMHIHMLCMQGGGVIYRDVGM